MLVDLAERNMNISANGIRRSLVNQIVRNGFGILLSVKIRNKRGISHIADFFIGQPENLGKGIVQFPSRFVFADPAKRSAEKLTDAVPLHIPFDINQRIVVAIHILGNPRKSGRLRIIGNLMSHRQVEFVKHLISFYVFCIIDLTVIPLAGFLFTGQLVSTDKIVFGGAYNFKASVSHRFLLPHGIDSPIGRIDCWKRSPPA